MSSTPIHAQDIAQLLGALKALQEDIQRIEAERDSLKSRVAELSREQDCGAETGELCRHRDICLTCKLSNSDRVLEAVRTQRARAEVAENALAESWAEVERLKAVLLHNQQVAENRKEPSESGRTRGEPE